MQALLDADVDVNYETDSKGPPLAAAITLGQADMGEFLLSKGADVNGMFWCPFLTSFPAGAAALRSTDVLKIMLDYGATISGSGALTGAAEGGNVSAAELLLAEGADVNEVLEQDLFREEELNLGTALHAAAEHGHSDMIKFLLSRGAKTHLRDGWGLTAEDVARRLDKVEIAKILEGST